MEYGWKEFKRRIEKIEWKLERMKIEGGRGNGRENEER